MSMFYAGRHRGPSSSSQASKRAGATMVAVAAVSLGTATIGAQSASAAPSAQSATSTASFSGLVKQGSRGTVVKQIQRKVGVSADGIFGPATRSAVKRWQKRHGLVADGIVGSRTGTKMGLKSGSTSTRSTRTTTKPSSQRTNFTGLVRQGSRGTVVKQVQRKVGVSADGIFGSGTAAAVKRWQRSHGLTADGVVGPRTGSLMGLTGSTRTSSTTSRTSTRTPVSGSGVLNTAASLVGTRYVMGGTTTSGFDCSGFTKYVFARNGKALPRTAEQQRQSTTRVSSPRAGDLVFFGAPAWHVGIYAGNGTMYDAGNSRVDTSKRAIWTSAVTYGRV
ncbi:C40 family peptidase [Janibacter limosus]|uniref:C40 family peptidase n=1 Tax=Janibacter limosus TaxID=53458 RepID=UPI000832CD89|nr:peptidoglycan-binding protein [Janibacter limosus]